MMIWLLLWCGSGALVGSLLGASIGRVRIGMVLGMFCGVFGWLMLVSAKLRERDLASSVADVLAGQRPEFSEDRGLALHESDVTRQLAQDSVVLAGCFIDEPVELAPRSSGTALALTGRGGEPDITRALGVAPVADADEVVDDLHDAGECRDAQMVVELTSARSSLDLNSDPVSEPPSVPKRRLREISGPRSVAVVIGLAVFAASSSRFRRSSKRLASRRPRVSPD